MKGNKEIDEAVERIIRLATTAKPHLLEKSKQCGCACCGAVFHNSDIKAFEGESGICPRCGMKSLIPGEQGIPLTPQALRKCSSLIHEAIMDNETGIVMFSNRQRKYINRVQSFPKGAKPKNKLMEGA